MRWLGLAVAGWDGEGVGDHKGSGWEHGCGSAPASIRYPLSEAGGRCLPRHWVPSWCWRCFVPLITTSPCWTLPGETPVTLPGATDLSFRHLPGQSPFAGAAPASAPCKRFPGLGTFCSGQAPGKNLNREPSKSSASSPKAPLPLLSSAPSGSDCRGPGWLQRSPQTPLMVGGAKHLRHCPRHPRGPLTPKPPNRGKAPWLGSACRRVQAGVGGRGINTRVTLLVPGRAARPLPTPGAGGSTHPRGARRGWGLAQGTPAQPGASPSPSFCAQRVGGAQGWWWWWGGGVLPHSSASVGW